MFAQLETATGEQRRDLFQQLACELICHEVCEQELLRPVSKRDAGEEIAGARTHEEGVTGELLMEMEKLDTDSSQFASELVKLRREVERHAEAEETQEFPRVQQNQSLERLEQMGRMYAVAKIAAPTRPYPPAPDTPVASMQVGPFAMVRDKARNAMRDAMKAGCLTR